MMQDHGLFKGKFFFFYLYFFEWSLLNTIEGFIYIEIYVNYMHYLRGNGNGNENEKNIVIIKLFHGFTRN